MVRDLRGFLGQLEEAGELIRIGEELSPKYEIAAAIKYIAEKKGTAVLFENVRGYNIPVVGNLFARRKHLAMVFEAEEDELIEAYLSRREKLIPPKAVSEAPVQEVVIDHDVDILNTIPVLTHHEKDAGPYFTSAITIAKDPETGMRGMGLHRIQVKGKDTLGILLATPPLSQFLAKADRMDKPLEIAVASGVDSPTFLSGCTPAPEDVDKFDIAGGLAQAPIELVKCLSVDVEVPANAEFMLEGEIIPHHREYEGPFGESSGYYLPFDSPVAKIRLITHRRNPIYRALMPFWSEEDILLGLLWGTGADVFLPLRKELPFVRQVNFRNFTGGIVIVQIEKESEDDVLKVIDYLLPSPWVKLVVVTDEDVDIWSAKDVDWVLSRVRLDKDLIVRTGLPGDLIDPSAMSAGKPFDHIPMITKVGIDATKPLAERGKFEKIRVPPGVEKEIAAKLRRLV